MHGVTQPKDWIARVLGIAGIAISVATLYFAFWRPPCIRVGLGPHIFVASKPRVGILATMANEGAQTMVVTSGELKVDDSTFTLPLTTTAFQGESWEYDNEGNSTNKSHVRYSFFTPFAVKPHDQASASFWFVATESFPLGAGLHRMTMVLKDAKQRSIVVDFEVNLRQTDITALYAKTNGKEQAGIEFPITIVSQSQTSSCPFF